jgi:hypothetical protein
VKNIINIRRSVQTVDVRTNNLCDNKFAIFVVELLRGPVRFDILKIKLDFILNIKAGRWLIILIREFFLLLLCCGHRSLSSVLYFTQLAKNTLFYLNRELTR